LGLISQYSEVKWFSSNRKWYEKILDEDGHHKYWFTHRGDVFIIKTTELPPTSSTVVTVYCDYCGYIYDTSFSEYMTRIKSIPMVCCNNVVCMKLKRETINLLKYGVKNQFQREEVKDKIIASNLEHRGVKYSMQSQDVLDKRIITNLEKFGAENNSQTNDWLEQTQKTQMLHYGMPFYFQTEEFKARAKITNIKKYGVEYISQNRTIRMKVATTMFKHGTCMASRQQVHINNLLGGILNYSNNTPNLDIAFPDDSLYCEYDGSGHDLNVVLGGITRKEFDNKQRRRSFFLKARGWKELRIISLKDRLPQDNVILELFNKGRDYLLNSNHTYFEIDIDKNRLWCKEYELTYNFVDLYKFPNGYKN